MRENPNPALSSVISVYKTAMVVAHFETRGYSVNLPHEGSFSWALSHAYNLTEINHNDRENNINTYPKVLDLVIQCLLHFP